MLQAASIDRYADTKDIVLVKSGPFALFSNFKLSTSSRKYLEDIRLAHIVSLMYKLITSSRDTDVLSTGLIVIKLEENEN